MSQKSHKITICGNCTFKPCGECKIQVFGKCESEGCEYEGSLEVIEHETFDGTKDYTALCKKCFDEMFTEIWQQEKNDFIRDNGKKSFEEIKVHCLSNSKKFIDSAGDPLALIEASLISSYNAGKRDKAKESKLKNN